MTIRHPRLIMSRIGACMVACLGAVLSAGCAPTFQAAIISDAPVHLKFIELQYPSGKRLVFRDVEPQRLKTFRASVPRGDVRMRWQEGSEVAGPAYQVALPPDRIKEAVQGPSKVLVLRIENDPNPHVLLDGVPAKEFSRSLLQRRGDAYPAVPVAR